MFVAIALVMDMVRRLSTTTINTWKNELVFGQSDACDFLMYIYTYQIQNEMIHSRESLEL